MSAANPGWLEITFERNTPGTAARTICGAAMRFALDSETGNGIEGVRQIGPDGVELGGCA